MKRICIFLVILYNVILYSSCPPVTSGERCWNVAVDALKEIITIESKLDLLSNSINTDISGIYTVAAVINSNVINGNHLLSTINSNLDELELEIITAESKLIVLESQINLINTFAQQIAVDVSGTFTALDALDATITSQLSIVITELENVEQTIDVITASSIDNTAIIADQLTVLAQEVNILNSALDITLPNIGFAVDTCASLVQILNANTNQLQNSITTNFAGTFTMLDAQFILATKIESITENIHIHNATDLTGVFTALNQVSQTLNNIESTADIVALINARNKAISIESLVDISVSYADHIISKIAPLPSVADHVISILEKVDLLPLDNASSKLNITATELDVIESSAETIESKLAKLVTSNEQNLSLLELIVGTATYVASNIDNITHTQAISKLERANSSLPHILQTEFTVESLLDSINAGFVTINSNIDAVIPEAQLINSILGAVIPVDVTISSELDRTITNLGTINSALNQIISFEQSGIALLVTTESYLDRCISVIGQLALPAIESNLAVTSNLETSVSSKLNNITQLITTANTEAQGLINDFQATWTILNALDSSLRTSQTTLNIIESTLEHLHLVSDISTVFTVIDTIVRNETTVNSQVDVYNNMVDAFSRRLVTDFNGVFTALNSTINTAGASGVTSSSLLSKISSELFNIQTELGFPIYTRDIPLTITTPGRYYLAENINYSGSSDAITINTNNVSIDLNERTLNYTGASSVNGIQINTFSNIRIINGTISGFNLNAASGSSNILVKNISVPNAVFSDIRNIQVSNSFAPASCSGTNIKVNNCYSKNILFFGIPGSSLATNIVVSEGVAFCGNLTRGIGIPVSSQANNCLFDNVIIINPNPNGIDIASSLSDRIDVKNCYIENAVGVTFNTGIGIISHSPGCVYVNTFITGCQNRGIALGQAVANSVNCYIGSNTFINNGINVFEALTGNPNTYLGNFAFNTTAVGNPNNNNYTLVTSNITGKYVTASQRGSFGDFPDKWHNINMLP